MSPDTCRPCDSGNSLGLNGHLLYKWQYELATKPVLLDMVQDLIGPDFYIWKSQFWIKEPQSNSFIGWHQVRHQHLLP